MHIASSVLVAVPIAIGTASSSFLALRKIMRFRYEEEFCNGLIIMDVSAVLESLLFVHGEPVAEKKLARVLEISAEELARGLAELRERLAGHGLALIEKEGEWQMVSHPDHARFVETLLKEQYTEDLSRAALETLAIVAYRGPMTRAEIEYIRGVNSSFSLRALLLRGLVERAASETDARSFVYSIGVDFLKYLGLARIGDLPEYEELKKISAAEPSADLSLRQQQ